MRFATLNVASWKKLLQYVFFFLRVGRGKLLQCCMEVFSGN